jgi:hypothetical protein
VTLRRDSLGLAADASSDSIRAVLERAVVRLRSAADFEVLAISPAILALQVRARTPNGSGSLAHALRRHPLVEAAEVESIVGP